MPSIYLLRKLCCQATRPTSLPLLTLVLALTQTAPAKALITFWGRAPIDYGSSINGLYKHDVLHFRLSLDDSIVDSDDRVYPAFGGGATGVGKFLSAATEFQLFRDPANRGSFDPSSVRFNKPASNITTIDANASPSYPGLFNEMLQFFFPVTDESLTAGAPFKFITLNLYNSTLFVNSNGYTPTPLLMDTSASGDPLTLQALFEHGGVKTLSKFRTFRPAEAKALVDGFFMEGLSGDLASGERVTLAYVPPVPSPFPLLGSLAAWRQARHLRRRYRNRMETQADTATSSPETV